MDKFNRGAEKQNLAFKALQRDLEECQRERDHQKFRADELEKEVDALKAEVSTKDLLNKKQQDALKDELEELKQRFSERELKHKTEVVCRLRDQKECIQALQKDFAESLKEKDLQDRRLRDKNEAYEALQSFFECSLKERDNLALRINELEKGKSLLEEEVDVLKGEASSKDQLNKKQINALKAKLKKQATFFSELSSQLSPEGVCRPKDLKVALQALQRDHAESLRERDLEKLRADDLAEKMSSQVKEVDALKAEDKLNKKEQDALKDKLEELKQCFSERELKHKTEVVCRLRDQKECIQALQKDFAESLKEKDLLDCRLRDKNEAYEALQSFFEYSLKERDNLALQIKELEKGKSLLEEEVDVLKGEASSKDQLNKKQINALKAKLKKQATFFSELSSQLSPERVCRPKDLKVALQALQRNHAESLREKDLEKLRADNLAEKMSSREKEVDALKAEDKLNKKQRDALKDELEELKQSFSERELKHKTEVVCRLRDQKECIQALQKDFAESLKEKDLLDRRLRDKNEAYEALQSFFECSLKERDNLALRINELEKGKSLLEEEVDVLKGEASSKDQLNKKQINALKAKLKKQATFFSELSSQLSPEGVCRPKDLKVALQALQRDLAESLREKDLEKLRADDLAEKMSLREKEVDALKAEVTTKDLLNKKEQDALKDKLEELKQSFSEQELKHKTEVVCRLRDQKECIQALQKDFAESLKEKNLQNCRLRDKNEVYEGLQSFFEFFLRERDNLALRINELETGKSLLEEVDVLKGEASSKDQLSEKQINALTAELKKQPTLSELSSQLSPEGVCRPKDLKEFLQALQRDLAESLREKDLEKLRADDLAEKMSSKEKEVDALKAAVSTKDKQYKKELDALKDELMMKNIGCTQLSSQLKAQREDNITLQRELDELHIEREHHMKSVDDLRRDLEEAKELFIEAENISAFRRVKKYFTPNSQRQFKLQMKLEKLGRK